MNSLPDFVLIFRHFGQCQRQSKCGETFWNTADRYWIIFRQALKTLPARFLDPLFLWPMYCHFGRFRTQSGGGKTFWKTADAFWIIFWQALLQNTLLAAISQFLDPLFLWPMYCHFGPCRRLSEGGKTFWKTADAFWMIFQQALLQNTLPAAISWFLEPLFLWPMYCHFGPCRMQSASGKTFWETADASWIILWQAYLQIIFPAAISWFLDPLFLLPMYCHFGECRRQSECGETFWKTADAFWIIFRQAYVQNTLAATHHFLTHFFYGDLPPLCAVLRVIQVPETPVFVDKFVRTFTWFIYSYSQYGITISKSRKSALKFTFPQHNYRQD